MVVAAVILILLVAIAFQLNSLPSGAVSAESGANENATEPPVRPLAVNVVGVRQVDSFQQTREFTGTIRARKRSDLGFELGGRIEEVNVDEGQSVQQGQTLATLDTQTLQANREAVAASLEQAKAQLAELKSGPRDQTKESAAALAAAADSQLQSAIRNFERRKTLYESGAISREEYDQAFYGVKTAENNFESAKQQYDELKIGTRKEKIVAQNSLVRQLEASLKEVNVSLQKANLVAPFDGVITRRYLDPGSIAGSGMPIVKLVEQSHLEAWIGLPIHVASKIAIGEKRTLKIEGQEYESIVQAKIGEIDQTQTQTVVFDIVQRAEAPIVSGQVCTVEIGSTVECRGYWVPLRSLNQGVRGLWSVMVVEDSDEGYVVA
ncbi:MAG: HlyD family efflux transporter periplasmic adaptor subunit, partial [Planctomycetota bacterium]